MSEEKDINYLMKKIEGLGNGPLTLIITCTECNSYFDMNRDSLTMAFMMDATFLEYVKYVQNAECPVCKEKAKNE